MAKPSDLRNKSGGSTPMSLGETISLSGKPADEKAPDGRGLKHTKPERGGGPSGPARAQGGAGQSSARPKV